jgi:hypothetical protein
LLYKEALASVRQFPAWTAELFQLLHFPVPITRSLLLLPGLGPIRDVENIRDAAVLPEKSENVGQVDDIWGGDYTKY